MNRFFADRIENNIAILDKDESFHLGGVLRLSPGDKVQIVHGGKLYLAAVIDNNKKAALAEIFEETPVLSEPRVKVTLFQAIPKGTKMEFAIQKCTELGIYEIVPMMTKRCVAKASDNKEERLSRIAFESCKQCKRVYVPKVCHSQDVLDIDVAAYDLIIIAYEDEAKTSLKQVLCGVEEPRTVAIIIGPEGGFEPEEVGALISRGARCVSLGKRILRSETAGMATLSALLYHYGEMEP